jgi:hypothetical protein
MASNMGNPFLPRVDQPEYMFGDAIEHAVKTLISIGMMPQVSHWINMIHFLRYIAPKTSDWIKWRKDNSDGYEYLESIIYDILVKTSEQSISEAISEAMIKGDKENIRRYVFAMIHVMNEYKHDKAALEHSRDAQYAMRNEAQQAANELQVAVRQLDKVVAHIQEISDLSHTA